MTETAIKPSAAKRTSRRTLDFYIVDTGWNEKAKGILDTHLELFESFLAEHRVFVLSREQSKEILKRHIALIGKDPLLVMVDSDARVEQRPYGYGVRLCLGAMHCKKIRDNLGMVLQIACDSGKTGEQVIREIRAEAHREGVDGVMEIIGEIIRPEV